MFGKVLVAPGVAADSNIVKAMRGLSPFGIDIDPPPPGAIFDRMPAERPAIPELSIQFIEKWINDGCPDDDVMELESVSALEAALGPSQFIVFFREFDQFFAFEASSDTRAAIGDFFNVAQTWPGFNQTTDLQAWTDAIAATDVKNAAQFLSDNQLRVIKQHFGDPLDLNSLNEALWQFGKGSLPPDNLRPQDRFHRMNGSSMWMMWLAFVDASIRSGMNAPQWTNVAKCVCLGLVGDALFRTDRLAVVAAEDFALPGGRPDLAAARYRRFRRPQWRQPARRDDRSRPRGWLRRRRRIATVSSWRPGGGLRHSTLATTASRLMPPFR